MARAERQAFAKPRGLFWFRAALQGAALSAVAMAGGQLVSSAATSLALGVAMMVETYAHSLASFYR
jgi:hypothetical protein